MQNTCSRFGWRRTFGSKGPLVWRELVSRGGKASLIGDSNDFQEFCRSYYNIKVDNSTSHLLKVSAENQQWTNIKDEEEMGWVESQKPTIVTVWNASTDPAQLTLSHIARGDVLPYDDIEIRLCTSPWITDTSRIQSREDFRQSSYSDGSAISTMDENRSIVRQAEDLEYIQADLEDLACNKVRRVINCGNNAISAALAAKLLLVFIDDSCLTLDSFEAFTSLGRELEATSRVNNMNNFLRVLFIPSNTECMARTLFAAASAFTKGILSTVECDLNEETLRNYQFHVNPATVLSLTNPLEASAKSLVAKLLHVNASCIHNLIVWSKQEDPQGNPWPFFVDLSNASVSLHLGAIEGPAPYTRSVLNLITHEKKFLQEIHDTCSARYLISTGKGLSLAASVAKFLQGWFAGREKHPRLEVEEHLNSLTFSVATCKLANPYFDKSTPSTPTTEEPSPTPQPDVTEQSDLLTSLSNFRSIPIRFTGRDDLEGLGYSIASDFEAPSDIFVKPKEIPEGEETAAVEGDEAGESSPEKAAVTEEEADGKAKEGKEDETQPNEEGEQQEEGAGDEDGGETAPAETADPEDQPMLD